MKETETIECPECCGECKVHNEGWRSCTRPVSECCGGCGEYVECSECGGTGEVEIEG